MWLIGVANEDIMLMGQLLGIKLAASEFIGYIQLADLKNVASGVHFTYNKSVIMATYMLCGFANLPPSVFKLEESVLWLLVNARYFPLLE